MGMSSRRSRPSTVGRTDWAARRQAALGGGSQPGPGGQGAVSPPPSQAGPAAPRAVVVGNPWTPRGEG